MSLFDSIVNYLKGAKTIEAPAGICPNCWGTQEYDGQLIEAVKLVKIDLNNVNEKKGWIQEYAVKHFEGIKLEHTDDPASCPVCKLTYQGK